MATLTQLALDHKLNTQQRKNYASLVDNAFPFACVCLLYLAVAEGVLRAISLPDEEDERAKTEDQLKRDPLFKLLKATLTSTERNLANIRSNQWGKLVDEILSCLEPRIVAVQ